MDEKSLRGARGWSGGSSEAEKRLESGPHTADGAVQECRPIGIDQALRFLVKIQNIYVFSPRSVGGFCSVGASAFHSNFVC